MPYTHVRWLLDWIESFGYPPGKRGNLSDRDSFAAACRRRFRRMWDPFNAAASILVVMDQHGRDWHSGRGDYHAEESSRAWLIRDLERLFDELKQRHRIITTRAGPRKRNALPSPLITNHSPLPTMPATIEKKKLTQSRGARGGKKRSPPAMHARSEQLLRLDQIAPSPYQPAGRTGAHDKEIDELAASFEEWGQKDPILVRPRPEAGDLRLEEEKGKSDLQPTASSLKPVYELVDGERRWRAAKKAKLTHVRAIVEPMGDADAAAMVGVSNLQRKSWSTLDKGAWLEQLTRSTAEGGCGMTQAEAGKLAGGISQGEVSNLIRLHQGLLPGSKWRERVISQEIEPTKARLLLPYLAHPALAKRLEQAWNETDYNTLSECRREEIPEKIAEALLIDASDVDNTYKYVNGQHVRLSAEEAQHHAKAIGLVEVPDPEDPKKTLRLATNERALSGLLEEKGKTAAAKKNKTRDKQEEKAAAKKKQETPAQRRAKAEKQADQLKARISDWRRKWLRKLLRDAMENASLMSDDLVLGTCAVWLFAYALRTYGQPAKEGLLELAYRGVSGKKPIEAADLLGDENGAPNGWEKLGQMVLELVWPSRDEDRVHPSGTDALYHIPDDVLEGLAVMAKIDLADEWAVAQTDRGTPVLTAEERGWVTQFLSLHNREQLCDLSEEWKLGVSRASAKRSELQANLETICFSGPRPLPKSIQPLKQPRQKARKK